VVNQAERILGFLRDSEFDLGGLIINRIAGTDGSGFLEEMRQKQEPYIQKLIALSGAMPVGKVPMRVEEIRGIAPLKDLGEKLLTDLGL